MPKVSIITIGSAGVDMRKNPLFLTFERAASATNLTFDESTIKVRFDVDYHSLGVKGQFQGASYFAPSYGLSATSITNAASALTMVVNGSLWVNPIDKEIGKPIQIEGVSFKGDTYLFDSENYLVCLNKESSTFWWSELTGLVRSPGLNSDGGESHDKLVDNENWLPAGSSIGHYIHGRNHISVDFGCNALNSEIWVSDLLGKRFLDDDNNEDILKMEEALLDSAGGTLIAPSKFGKTLALETLLDSNNNGEGILVDFREAGIVFHDTFQTPRETIFDPESEQITQQGWDEKRITNVKLQSVSAVGRYAVYQLPDDIWFRSEYGFHTLKKTLGQGTLADETRNHQSHDVQPLIDLDEDGAIEGVAAGYWVRNDRLMGTVGMKKSQFHSSSSMGRGIVVLNQATTYTEDNTPRPLWEGLWVFDEGIEGIHKFSRAGKRPKDKNFGFFCSDRNRYIYFGEFKNRRTGYDTRGKKFPIPWQYTSGAFIMSGIRTVDAIRNGVLDYIGDESTGDVTVQIRTDQCVEWKEWFVIKSDFKERSLKSKAFGEPPEKSREGTWFQFKISGKGYVELRNFDVDFVKIVEKDDGRNYSTPICFGVEDYFKI